MRPKEGEHFRSLHPDFRWDTYRAEVPWGVGAGPGAAMSAALLRRGLELLGPPEGEQSLRGDFPRGPGRPGLRAGTPGVRNDSVAAWFPVGWEPCALSDPGPPLSSPAAAAQAAPGQAQPSGAAPGKQAAKAKAKAKAKATQAGKLRNSAKGKVPKSALGKVGRGRRAAPGAGLCPAGRGPWRPSLRRESGLPRAPAVRRAESGGHGGNGAQGPPGAPGLRPRWGERGIKECKTSQE